MNSFDLFSKVGISSFVDWYTSGKGNENFPKSRQKLLSSSHLKKNGQIN
jgi:hypothetical protein